MSPARQVPSSLLASVRVLGGTEDIQWEAHDRCVWHAVLVVYQPPAQSPRWLPAPGRAQETPAGSLPEARRHVRLLTPSPCIISRQGSAPIKPREKWASRLRAGGEVAVQRGQGTRAQTHT